MRQACLALAVTLLMISAGSAQPSPPRTRVLVELFTSEGCSSCPPADDLLRRLIRDQPLDGIEIIALSEHVDYWDHLGWRDPFSSSLFTRRQEEYLDRFDGNGMYTPQIVIDGRFQTVGSNAPVIRAMLIEAAKAPKAVIDLHVASAEAGSVAVRVDVRELPADVRRDIDVIVAVAESGLVSDVKRGENASRKLAHDAVVRTLETIGTLARDAAAGTLSATLKTSPRWNRDGVRLVAFLQHRRTRQVVGVSAAVAPR